LLQIAICSGERDWLAALSLVCTGLKKQRSFPHIAFDQLDLEGLLRTAERYYAGSRGLQSTVWHLNGARRVATFALSRGLRSKRRYATIAFGHLFRGLKSTATGAASLRDASGIRLALYRIVESA